MATQPSQKILRIGIIQNGRIIEERLLRTRESVTVGEGARNSFVIIGKDTPQSHKLFDVRSGAYVLRFNPKMSGRISVGSGAFDLSALRESGKAKAEGDSFAIQLDERSRGKLVVGEATILFQFVNAPPLRLAPTLPTHMRGGPLLFLSNVMGLSGVFLVMLLTSAFLQIGLAWYLIERVPPPQRASSLEQLRDQLVNILPDEPIIPEEDEEEPEPLEEGTGEAVAEEDSEPTPAPERPQQQEAAPEPRRRDDTIREEVAQQIQERSALQTLMAGVDNGASTIADFTGTLSNRSAEDIIGSQAQLGTGNNGVVASAGIGVSDGSEGTVGRVGIGDGGQGSTVAREAQPTRDDEPERTRTVTGRIRGGDTRTAGSGRVDQAQLNRYINRQNTRLQQCYNRELASNPSLNGRIQIEFTIEAGGSVSEASIRNNELNDSVGNCILREVRRWRPGEVDGGSVTVRRTYLFEPGN
jgi:outer membrane biosynthesis protein TonB